MTWLFHSSIAAVLLLVALAGRGFIPPELGIVLVLGVNLGSSVIAPLLTRRAEPRRPRRADRQSADARRRLAGDADPVPVVQATCRLPRRRAKPTRSSTRHILFNCIILLAGLPLAAPIYRLSEKIVALGTPPETADAFAVDGTERTRREGARHPSQALANATREVVRVCETIEIMLKRDLRALRGRRSGQDQAIAALDDRVDRQHAAIKLYLAKVTIRPLSEEEALRCQELIGACVKLEQVGDIIVRNMLAHVQKKFDRGLEFTDEGWRELAAFHASVMANARLAFNVLISRDPGNGAAAGARKGPLRDLEKQPARAISCGCATARHKSVETSSIHLDTIRDLKQVNSLLASMAYPVLEERGLLTGSRLKAG